MAWMSAAVLAVVVVMLVACGTDLLPQSATAEPEVTATPSPPVVTFPTPPIGWTVYSRSTYQLALPDSWQTVKLQEGDLRAVITAAQNSNPPLAEQLRALLESGQYKSFVFYATDATRGQALQNVSVARVTLGGTNDLEAYARSYAQGLPNVVRGAQVVEVQVPLRINGLAAALVVYDVSLVDDAGALTKLRGVQYLFLLSSGDAYLVTVTGPATDAARFMTLARQIGTSFVGVNP